MTPKTDRSDKITIIHLAVDYNTPYRPRTTMAVEWLVDELSGFDNVVIAMLRSAKAGSSPRWIECAVPAGAGAARLFHFAYFGLPWGIGLHRAMRKTAQRIITLLEREGICPRLVHAHKFTFEGLAGWYVARHFNVPLFVSLRGEVETKVFRAKPLLRPFLRRVAHDAARLYFVSAWFEPLFHGYVPGAAAKERRLPNIVRNITPRIAIRTPDKGLVTVLNLDTRKRKGLSYLLDAMTIAVREQPELTLDIIGGGSATSVRQSAAMIEQRGLGDSVRLIGSLTNADLLERLPRYRGLALPSLNETFGMVYVESLFAGVPVLYTARTAVDRYLDGLGVAVVTPPRNSPAIAVGLLELWRHSERFRENIIRAAPALFATFDPAAIMARYRDDVRLAIGEANTTASEE